MRRPPRPRTEPLLSGFLVWHIILVAILFLGGVFGIYAYAIDLGRHVEYARTMAMNTLVVMEIFHLLYIRNMYVKSLTWKAVRGTRAVWIAVIIVAIGQIAITYIPPLQTVFETQAVGVLDSLLIFLIGVVLFTIIESEKQLRIRVTKLRHN